MLTIVTIQINIMFYEERHTLSFKSKARIQSASSTAQTFTDETLSDPQKKSVLSVLLKKLFKLINSWI